MSKEMKNLLDDLAGSRFSSGDILRAFRKRVGLSQEELANLTGIERPNISALENDRLEFTQHYAEICAAALGLHPTELLYPNGNYSMSKRAKEVARKAKKYIKEKKVG